MKFSVVAVLAAASSALAQTAGFDPMSKPTEGQNLTAGEPFDIVWDPNGLAGTISIRLIQGTAANTLMMGPSVATGVNNLDGKYTWAKVPDAEYAAYGFNLTSDQDPSKYQLSFGFHIVGKSSSASSYPAATSSAGGYPTSPKPSYTSTITLSPGPSYSQYMTTSTPVSTYKPTYPASNSTWVSASTQPAGTGYPTSSVAPITSTGPTSTPSSPVQPGSATRFGASGLAAIAGLAMALAL